MTLEAFCDLWTRKNRTIVLCESESYDEMFDIIDSINDGDSDLSDILQYVIGAIVPQLSQYKESVLIDKKWSKSTVTDFYIGKSFVIIWIKPRGSK